MHSSPIHEKIAQLLTSFQDHLREHLLEACSRESSENLATVSEISEADTIYHIDKISEKLICDWFSAHWPETLPVELVMEGIDESNPLTFPVGTSVPNTEWKCIIDPIDGTRNIMYDKRSAWILTGVAPQSGPKTSLQDIEIAAMTSIPSSREWRSDQVSAIRGQGYSAQSYDVINGKSLPLIIRPSTASNCRHGFATITRFFPDGLGILGQLEERLWQELYPDTRGESPQVFNDQYLTTGGQLFELMIGHDRFIADLRPLVFKHLGLKNSLTCHPYDMSALLVASEVGIIIEDPLSSQPVDYPLDTTTPVSWVGFANEEIALQIRPVLKSLIHEILQL